VTTRFGLTGRGAGSGLMRNGLVPNVELRAPRTRFAMMVKNLVPVLNMIESLATLRTFIRHRKKILRADPAFNDPPSYLATMPIAGATAPAEATSRTRRVALIKRDAADRTDDRFKAWIARSLLAEASRAEL
jgi:hypothetical protein